MRLFDFKNVLLISVSITLINFYSCKQPKKNLSSTVEKEYQNVTKSIKQLKTKVGKNTYPEARQRTKKWFKNLVFDPKALRQKNFKVQKHFAEYLGLANLLYKTAKTPKEKNEIKDYIFSSYQYTLEPAFHNLDKLDAKSFKANSMSYLRILFLLNSFGFDTTFYTEEVQKIKKRLDGHLNQRGDWQKWAFENYYNALDLKKPPILNNINSRKGIVNRKIPAEKYSLMQAYELTHLIFAAYNYGASKTQNKFNFSDFAYLKETLNKLSKKYRQKNNRDILSELVTCMSLINSDSSEFKMATNYLLRTQNYDGTWGNYEKARKKYGKLIEIRLYLHTTLVVYESLSLQFDKK